MHLFQNICFVVACKCQEFARIQALTYKNAEIPCPVHKFVLCAGISLEQQPWQDKFLALHRIENLFRWQSFFNIWDTFVVDKFIYIILFEIDTQKNKSYCFVAKAIVLLYDACQR